jgi:Domain of unknown function (DUF3806)
MAAIVGTEESDDVRGAFPPSTGSPSSRSRRLSRNSLGTPGKTRHLATACDLSWVVATDEHGTEIALHEQPGQILIYPTNLVAKRWTAVEDAFIANVFVQIQGLGSLDRAVARRQVEGVGTRTWYSPGQKRERHNADSTAAYP